MSTLRGPSQLGNLQGALCVPTNNFTCGVDELDTLLWQRSSNLSDLFFVAILLFLSIEPTTLVPSRVATQWRERPSSYNGDHNSGDMAGAHPVGRRTRTTRTAPFKYVRTTLLCGVHSLSRILVPPVGRRAHTTQTTPSEYVRTTLLFGEHSSSRPLVASVHRQLVIDHSAWNCPSPTFETCLLRALPACCTAHLRELPAQAPRSAIDLYFFCASGL